MNQAIAEQHIKRLQELTGRSFEQFLQITDTQLDELLEGLAPEQVYELEFLIDRLMYLNDEDSKYNAMKLNEIKDIFDNR